MSVFTHEGLGMNEWRSMRHEGLVWGKCGVQRICECCENGIVTGFYVSIDGWMGVKGYMISKRAGVCVTSDRLSLGRKIGLKSNLNAYCSLIILIGEYTS